jgi:serine/threonine protein phosphatase 1
MARILAIGDIHGCYDALQSLIAMINLQSTDTLVTLGDYSGKGPDSSKVMDWLISMHNNGNVVPIRGNHEILLMNARNNKKVCQKWLKTGGVETLRSYGANVRGRAAIDMIPQEHWHFLENFLQPIHVTDNHFFVHATVLPNTPFEKQTKYFLYWKKFKGPVNHYSGKIMICGHTAQKTGLPAMYGRAICIDTRVYDKRGWLSCLDVGTNHLYQANQKGETRQFRFDSWNRQ